MFGVSQSEDQETGVYISNGSSFKGLGGVIGWSAIFLIIGIIFGIVILCVCKRCDFIYYLSKFVPRCCQSKEPGEYAIQLLSIFFLIRLVHNFST